MTHYERLDAANARIAELEALFKINQRDIRETVQQALGYEQTIDALGAVRRLADRYKELEARLAEAEKDSAAAAEAALEEIRRAENAEAAAEAALARLRAALEWVIAKAQQTAIVEGRGADTVAEYFQMYVYLPVRLEKSDFEMLQAALRPDDQPAARELHTHFCQHCADRWECNDAACKRGEVFGCLKSEHPAAESEGNESEANERAEIYID